MCVCVPGVCQPIFSRVWGARWGCWWWGGSWAHNTHFSFVIFLLAFNFGCCCVHCNIGLAQILLYVFRFPISFFFYFRWTRVFLLLLSPYSINESKKKKLLILTSKNHHLFFCCCFSFFFGLSIGHANSTFLSCFVVTFFFYFFFFLMDAIANVRGRRRRRPFAVVRSYYLEQAH